MLADKVIKKAKLLTSNFSTEEQIKEIKKTFISLKATDNSFMKIDNSFYTGLSVSKFHFFQESSIEETINKTKIDLGNFLGTLSSGLLRNIFFLLKENSTNRLISVSCKKDKITINDFLFNKEVVLAENHDVKDYYFTIDSRIFYYFKLNQKTITKNTKIFIFSKGFVILNKRKQILFFICIK